MKLIVTVAMRGTEFACNENLVDLISSFDPTILDACNIDIRTFTEEELEK